MRSAKSRLGKGYSLDARLDACSEAVERSHYGLVGKWDRWVDSSMREQGELRDIPFRQVRLDLGCGKGAFTVESAKAAPDVLFVGVDVEEVCTMRAAELALREGVCNAVFVLDHEPDLARMFAPGELSQIFLMFPTPFPQKKRAHLRTTYADRLAMYRTLLAPGGLVRFETDSQPFYDFTRIQFDLAGYDVLWESTDLESDRPQDLGGEYKARLTAKGAKVFALEARNGDAPIPVLIEHTEPLSLIDYLPEDLESMAYVPHGMEGCITNMRNRRRRERERSARHSSR